MKKSLNPVLFNHNNLKECDILYWDNLYFLCGVVSFFLRSSSKFKCYSCLKCCVSFRTQSALDKHLELANTKEHVGRRTLQFEVCLKFDKYHYKNRVTFTMEYDFECKKLCKKNTFLLLAGCTLKVIPRYIRR